MTALLELRKVTKVFGKGKAVTVALDNMSFAFEEDFPHIITVAGESGSGKTTMGMLLLGFYTPTRGEVLYKGQNIHKLSKQEMFCDRP